MKMNGLDWTFWASVAAAAVLLLELRQFVGPSLELEFRDLSGRSPCSHELADSE